MRVPLIYKEAPQFGFDIGIHSIKVVQLKRAGHSTKVQGYGSCYFPRDAMSEGIVVDPAAMAKSIKPLLKQLGYGKLTSKRVIVGLPATKLFTRTLQVPQMDSADLAQAIHYEVEQYVPVPIADLYIDYEILNTNLEGKDPQTDVLMVAAPRAIVDSYLTLFEHLGLEIGAIEANMTAVVRALLHSGDAGSSTLIINSGSVSTDLTLYDKFIPLTGSVPVGGEKLTATLMSALGVKADQATEILQKFGIGESGMHDKVVAALEPQLAQIIKEIKRIIKFYESRGEKQQKVGSVVVSGGTAVMPGLDEYFRTKLDLPLTIANPWKNLKIHNPPADHAGHAAEYTTAVGLALRGLL